VLYDGWQPDPYSRVVQPPTTPIETSPTSPKSTSAATLQPTPTTTTSTVQQPGDKLWYEDLASYSPLIALGAALVAIVSVIVAVCSARAAWRGLRGTEEARRREQAAKFAVWLTRDGSFASSKVWLHNGSDLPIFDVHIQIQTGGTIRWYRIGTVNPTSKPETHHEAGKCLISAMQEHMGWTTMSGVDMVRAILGATGKDWNPFEALGIKTKFRDSEGRRWARDVDGALSVAKP